MKEDELRRGYDEAIKQYARDQEDPSIDPDQVLRLAKVFSWILDAGELGGAMVVGRATKVPLKYLGLGALAVATYKEPIVLDKLVKTIREVGERN